MTNATEPKGANCPEGGSKFTVGAGAPTFACNGSPWVAGGTLPSGETVMGAWGASSKVDVVSISYAVPLSAAPTVEFHEVGYEGEAGDNCPGEASNPEAKKGFLCVYSEEVFGIEYKTGSGFPFSTPSGAVLHFEGEFGIALGTWAATAP